MNESMVDEARIGVYRSAIHDGTWTAVVHDGGYDEAHMVDWCGPLRVVQARVRAEFGEGRFVRGGRDRFDFVPLPEVADHG